MGMPEAGQEPFAESGLDCLGVKGRLSTSLERAQLGDGYRMSLGENRLV